MTKLNVSDGGRPDIVTLERQAVVTTKEVVTTAQGTTDKYAPLSLGGMISHMARALKPE